MMSIEMLLLLVVIGIIGGVIAGIGGPGGIPVLLVLNLVLVLSPSVAAATASSIFVLATITATGLYYYSDGIDWRLAITVGLPALVGTHFGAVIASSLPIAVFELILGGVLILAAAGIVYQQRTSRSNGVQIVSSSTGTFGAVLLGSLIIGVLAGITGIGGPALTVPLMILLGINPIVAIGAGLASGIIITVNTTLGHVVQGNGPALLPGIVIGIPYVVSQLLGWRYVHSVSTETVSYTIAAIGIAGGLIIVI